MNVQLVCDSDMKIINIVARCPGSAHDTTIFNNSRLRARFEAGEFENAILLGIFILYYSIYNMFATCGIFR